jgi:serine/threonine protein kinase
MTDNNNSSARASHIYQNSIENNKNDTIDMYTNYNYNPKNTMVNINGSDNNYNNTNNMTDNNIRRNHKNGNAFINISKKRHYIYKINNPIKTLKIHTNILQNHINIIPVPKSKHFFLSGENGIKKKEMQIINLVPGDDFNPHEFNILQQIGKGGFGKIYSVRWSKNNKIYALKKIHLTKDEILLYRNKVKIIQNLVKKTGHNGFIKIYGDKCIKQNDLDEYNYYIIMELGERDWLKELKMREECQLFYTEYELFGIALQLIKSLTIMQNHNITHRDIKPQNILLIKGAFKICDFGEVTIINGNGPALLPIGGSELYMSPILYYAVKNKQEKVLHNTYKSDVFSLGMCLLLAAGFSRKLLLDIRKIKDMNTISEIIQNALNSKYSQKFISLIITMLQIDENLRFDFNELQRYISNNFQC